MSEDQKRLTIGAVAVFLTTLVGIFVPDPGARLAVTGIIAGIAGYLVPKSF